MKPPAESLEGLQRIWEANLKQGRQIEKKLVAQNHEAKVKLKVLG